jgi:hypothetical protein
MRIHGPDSRTVSKRINTGYSFHDMNDALKVVNVNANLSGGLKVDIQETAEFSQREKESPNSFA